MIAKEKCTFTGFLVQTLPGFQKNCNAGYGVSWINFANLKYANVLARYYIEKQNCKIIKEVVATHWVEKDEFQIGSLGRQCYNEAIEQGFALAFYALEGDELENPVFPYDSFGLIS